MSFYQTNSKILSKSIKGSETIDFNKYPDLLEILFNHWISQKENYNRTKSEFERGEFELSLSIIKSDFGIKDSKARNLIKRFVSDEIIKLKNRGSSSNNKSIYVYLSVLEKVENKDIVKDIVKTQLGHSKTLKNQYINTSKRHSKDIVSDIVVNNSKKELKKELKKDINSASSEALWKLYPNKKNKAKAIKKIPKLISEYGYDQLEKCIKRYMDYVESERKNGFNSLNYQVGSTFFNGTYIDYLDENYEEQYKQEQPKEERKAFSPKLDV